MQIESSQIAIVDDHALFRTGMCMILKQYAGVRSIVEAGDIEDFLSKTQHLTTDIVLLDIELPGTNGIEGIDIILENQHSAKIIMLSATVNETKVDRARDRGALGFLHKSATAEQIVEAINRVIDGKTSFDQSNHITDSFRSISRPGTNVTNLTTRQQEVLKPLCEGLSNRAIAQRMGLSENTVRIHVSAILRAFDAINRSEVILIAQREGMID